MSSYISCKDARRLMLGLAELYASIREDITIEKLIGQTKMLMPGLGYDDSLLIDWAPRYAFDSLVYDNFLTVDWQGFVRPHKADLPMRHRAHFTSAETIHDQLREADSAANNMKED